MLRERIWGKSRWLGLPLAAVLLTGCGDDAQQADNGAGPTTLSGSVFASYVDGATCVVRAGINEIAGPFTTSASGGYSIVLPDSHLAENLVVECTGGTFVDEATGATQTAGAMSAYIAGGTSSVGTSVHVTPSTTIIAALVEGGMGAGAAVEAFTAAFGFSPDFSVAPTDATNPAAGADNARLLAGLRAATFSQLADDLGIEQFELIAALAADLADGTLGNGTTLPADIQNLFTQALVNFRAGGRDASGVDNSELGVMSFAKTVLTDSYKMVYVPGMHGAVNGKTAFSIRVTNRSDDTPASGLAVSIDPLMNMDRNPDTGMVRLHKTPYIANCDEMVSESGEYHCTVYYVMPSVMGMGEMAMSMGYWQLAVTAGAESANFYPKVTMAMGDTVQARMTAREGDADTVMAMGGGTEARTYYLFKDGLSGMTGDHQLDLFIATRDTMMSFPSITMTSPTPAGARTFDPISVQVSTDGGDSWDPLVEGNPGHWSITGLTGLENGVQAEVLVELTVENLPKVANGNPYAVFTLTPGGGMMHMPM